MALRPARRVIDLQIPMYTRRTFANLLAVSALAAKPTPGGVTMGAQTYSLRDRDAGKAILALKEL